MKMINRAIGMLLTSLKFGRVLCVSDSETDDPLLGVRCGSRRSYKLLMKRQPFSDWVWAKCKRFQGNV